MNDPTNKASIKNPKQDHFFSEGVYFSPLFSRIRNKKSKFKIPETTKLIIEQSIKRFKNGE